MAFPYFKQVGIGALSGAAVLALMIAGFNLGAGTPDPTESPSASQSASQSASPSASPTAVACSAAKQASNSRLGTLYAAVVDSATGTLLFDRQSNVPVRTASMLKLVTATVALQAFGPNYRIDTKVYQDGSDPSIIYIVGGGDVTLSNTAAGKQSVYRDGPKLSTLATAVNQALGTTAITKIIADDSLFTGDNYRSDWNRNQQTIGYMSEVSALQVDGDRKDPTKETSPRTTDPTMNAAKKFRLAIGSLASGATVETGVLPSGAKQIAKVSSAPLSTWITHMLQVSDNTQAEALARLVSIKAGFDGSFDSIDAAYKKLLKAAGADATGMTFVDGSGYSDLNAVSPIYMTKLMKVLVDTQGDLKYVRSSMTVAGETGSLASRFTGQNADAAGKVFGKTGWIQRGYTLGGFIYAKDGSTLLYAVYALDEVKDDAKKAIDNLVAQFYRCGSSLGNE